MSDSMCIFSGLNSMAQNWWSYCLRFWISVGVKREGSLQHWPFRELQLSAMQGLSILPLLGKLLLLDYQGTRDLLSLKGNLKEYVMCWMISYSELHLIMCCKGNLRRWGLMCTTYISSHSITGLVKHSIW